MHLSRMIPQTCGNKPLAIPGGRVIPALTRPPPRYKEDNMTKKELTDAIEFLRRLFVGPGEVDRLEAAIKSLQTELARRNKK